MRFLDEKTNSLNKKCCILFWKGEKMNLDVIEIIGRTTINILAGVGLSYIINRLNQRFK